MLEKKGFDVKVDTNDLPQLYDHHCDLAGVGNELCTPYRRHPARFIRALK